MFVRACVLMCNVFGMCVNDSKKVRASVRELLALNVRYNWKQVAKTVSNHNKFEKFLYICYKLRL